MIRLSNFIKFLLLYHLFFIFFRRIFFLNLFFEHIIVFLFLLNTEKPWVDENRIIEEKFYNVEEKFYSPLMFFSFEDDGLFV